jgi:cytochrome c oxidase subunit 2
VRSALFYEKLFLILSAATLLILLGAILVGHFAMGIHTPEPVGRVDPAQVASTAPFDRPGIVQTGDGRYRVAMISQVWSFAPNEIRIPAGSELEIVSTSRDVIHGLRILRTNVNVMLIPGQVSRVRHVFREPGEYLMVCHEYCGVGHQGMYGRIVVEPSGREPVVASAWCRPETP